MAPWPSISSLYIDNYRKYNEPQCITKYINYQQEIQKQIEALSYPKNFCTKCQKIKQEINEKNNELKNCYAYNILTSKLIDIYEINAFMEKCLEPSKCRYNEASNVRNPPALKSKSETTCGRSNVCNRVATPVKESAGKVQPVLNPQSPEIKLPVMQEEGTIKQPHAEGAVSTKANTNLFSQNNISNPNDPVVAQPEPSNPKGIHPSGTTGQVYISEQPVSASHRSSPSELGNSSEDSSPQVTRGSEPSLISIDTERNSETSSHESKQRNLQHVNGHPLGAQKLERATSAGQGFNIEVLDDIIPGARDLHEISPGGRIHSNSVVDGILDKLSNLGGKSSLLSEFTAAAADGENYITRASLETPVGKPPIGESTGDNSEAKYKNYTAMALAPTGVIMLMTLLSKYTSLGMLFTKKRRNTRKDIRQNIERILLLESPAKTEESSYSFAYSPSQYWEK